MANIKTGLTLFSLGTPYLKGELDLEGVIRTAAEIGATGYEIFASQMIPSYPYVSDEFLEFVEMCRSKYGIGPVSYGANMDRGMLRDRDLTEDEMVARAITDIISANKLGCTVMREQFLLSPQGLARIAPYAEAYNVRDPQSRDTSHSADHGLCQGDRGDRQQIYRIYSGFWLLRHKAQQALLGPRVGSRRSRRGTRADGTAPL